MKERGLPPCEICVALYKYEDLDGERALEFPIMENDLIRGYASNYFDEIIRRISREEEIRIILETTTFHPDLKESSQTLRDANMSFEEERYSHTKTSCRKILEGLRERVPNWKTIDGSESACEKFKGVLNSMYSFASVGGPHPGISTREETEFILKAVAGTFFYVNTLLKNGRMGLVEG